MAGDRERELLRAFTGLVVESLAVKQDFGTATVGCRGCSAPTTLSSGDRVTIALSCYEDHSWEIQSVFCAEHAIDSIEDVMDIRPEQQGLVSAVLESTGYLPPDGNFQPDALTLGEVEIVDFSPTREGYER